MVLRQSVETKGNLLSFKLQTACTYTEAATAVLNQEVLNKKKLHKHLRTLEGGGVNQTASSTFDTIHPIDKIFGTYDELPLYFQSQYF